ncbi:MAG: hypothetical protein IKW59_08235 [Clostridia bacterium]|nr:hypothetical protein [Clostridia bacterium]
MKKILSLALSFLIVLSCMTFSFASATTEQTEAQKLLDEKKVLIIGNSFVYYGLTVINKKNTVLTQSQRSNDKGYFYQLCKANGINVSVTNWCFASHSLTSLFGGECNVSACNKVKHEDYLTDRYFDYVIISPGNGSLVEKNIASDFEYIMEFFRKANPNVKFVCMGPLAAHGINSNDTFYPGITGYYPTLKEKGVIIADWGKIVKDILKGNCTIPGATQSYLRSSFVVKDNYHPNVLSGYITTLITYCAITGESALAQPYSFYNNTSLNSNFNMDNYVANRYTNGYKDTNFDKIFASPSDMKGIQMLVDRELKANEYNIKATKGDGALNVNSDVSLENTLLVCALYSENSKLSGVKFLNVESNTKTASFYVSNDTWNSAKIFVWENLDYLYPLDEAATINFAN